MDFFETPETPESKEPEYHEAPQKVKAEKGSDYREKYPELIEELRQQNLGKLSKDRTNKDIATDHQISEALLYRVKKCIFV